jgi:hypothetical protein
VRPAPPINAGRAGMQPQRGGFRASALRLWFAGLCGRAGYGSRFEVASLFFGTFFWVSKRKYMEGKANETKKVSGRHRITDP